MSYISPTLKLLIAAVKKASNSMNRDFSEIEKLLSSVKNYSSFVNDSFEKVEKNLQYELAKIKPDYPILKEWKSDSKTPYFLVAKDGVENFSHGLGFFTFCISLMDVGGNALISVIYNPAMDELYFAEKGNGAYKEGFRNHERLRVSSRKELDGAVVATNFAYGQFVSNLRVFGASSLELAYLASGKIDVILNKGINSAVLAAGILLVKEAGGSVYELGQKDIRSENVSAVLVSEDVFAVNNGLSKKVYEVINS